MPNHPMLRAAALMLACALAICLTLAACTPERSGYDFDAIQTDGQFKHYAPDGQVVSRLGIDVAEHQEYIDWPAVHDAGIDFAMLRVGYRGYTEGSLHEDPTFRDNAWGAQAAGLDVGVYFFSQAVNEQEAHEEAYLTVEILRDTGVPLSYPVAYDLEIDIAENARTANLTGAQATRNARAFCQIVEQAGYRPMVYLNSRDAFTRFDVRMLSSLGYLLWYANYDAATPSLDFKYAIWQYTDNGQIPGVDAAVDLNLAFYDLAA